MFGIDPTTQNTPVILHWNYRVSRETLSERHNGKFHRQCRHSYSLIALRVDIVVQRWYLRVPNGMLRGNSLVHSREAE